MNNFKIIFKTPITYSQLKEVESFIEMQLTTDRVRENSAHFYKGDEADYLIIVMLDDFGDIKEIRLIVL